MAQFRRTVTTRRPRVWQAPSKSNFVQLSGRSRTVTRVLGATMLSSLALAGKARAVERVKGAQLTQALALASPTRNNHALRNEALADWVTTLAVNNGTDQRRAIYTARVTAGSADSIRAPNNTVTGEAMMETAVSGDHLREGSMHRAHVPVGTTVVYSDHVQGGLGRDWVALSVYDGRNAKWWLAWFNIATGTVGFKDSGIDSSGIAVDQHGWYRPWIKYTAASGVGTDHIYLGTYIATADGAASGTPGDGANRPQYLGDITKGVYVWGAMWDVGASALNTYLPATGALLDRIEYASVPRIRGGARVKGATMDTFIALIGRVRELERLKGATLTQSQPLAGKLRDVSRLKGAALTQSQPLTGRVREVTRVKGASLSLVTFLRGYVRGVERVKGATLTQSQPMVGKVRGGERLKGAALTQALALQGRVRELERVKAAALAQSQPLAGKVRSGPRLKGATFGVDLALTGRVRQMERLLGARLTQAQPLSGRIRELERTLGANLTQSLALGGGKVRVVARVKGGTLTFSIALSGKVRDIARLKAATLDVFAAEIGALLGSAHIYPLLDGHAHVAPMMEEFGVAIQPMLDGDVDVEPQLIAVIRIYPL